MGYHVETKQELVAAMRELGLIGLSVLSIDTIGCAELGRLPDGKWLETDDSLDMKLSDGRTLAVYASSYEDVYCGFDFAFNPKREDDYRDNDLNLTDAFKYCLNTKIVNFEVTKYGDDIDEGIKNITPDSPKELIIIFENGVKLYFSHFLYAGYMYVDMKRKV